jgi:hypothetical protein
MNIEITISGYAIEATRLRTRVFTREWPCPPRIGELVHLFELTEPEKWGLDPAVAKTLVKDLRVKDVWWGPFEDAPGVDVYVTLIAGG